MKRSLLCSLAISGIFFCGSCTHSSGNKESEKHMTLDEQIAALKEQRRVYLLRAQYFQRKVQWIFPHHDWVEYRRCVVRQQHYEKLAKETEAKIEQLEKRRDSLLYP